MDKEPAIIISYDALRLFVAAASIFAILNALSALLAVVPA